MAFRIVSDVKLFTRKQVVRIYTKYYRDAECADPGGMARKLFEATQYQSFLDETPDGRYRFWHEIFRDYFALRHQADRDGWSKETFIRMFKWRWGGAWFSLSGLANWWGGPFHYETVRGSLRQKWERPKDRG